VRRLLAEAAQAAVKKKGRHFQAVFRRLLPRLTYQGSIEVVAHGLTRLVWKILHDGVSYLEQGQDTHPRSKKRRAQNLAQALRNLGYSVTLTEVNPGPCRRPTRDFQHGQPQTGPLREIFNGAAFPGFRRPGATALFTSACQEPGNCLALQHVEA
jgi:hypothetical protein